MPETFHLFPRLPLELQQTIWKLAIRLDGATRPGAHFFSVLTPRKDEDAGSLMDQSLEVLRRASGTTYHLVGPRWTTKSTEDRFVGIKREPASWTDNNPSAYLIDNGLWLACQESRRIIQHAYCNKSPWQISMPSQNNADRLVTVFRENDLFCFQPSNWHPYNFRIIKFLVVLFDGLVGNIAIEYNPQWGIDMENSGEDYPMTKMFVYLRNLCIEAGLYSSDATVWFIDYRIKRRQHVPTKEQSEAPMNKVFYQDGRRFVDVNISDQDSPWETPHADSPWELSYEVAEGEWTSCKPFVDALHDALADHLAGRVRVHYRATLSSLTNLGVLACEED
ncbi:hypothetical protein N0V84_004067 [Fusarium piperis]|uniref:2EXR domain-containing protein n=1 Tax=Fusarium piperis TaxID=1435070 RepID=A0A9W9BQ61_9HYPO|nr:hypothetical protein N0V84_004067 [Fusarium piperis]